MARKQYQDSVLHEINGLKIRNTKNLTMAEAEFVFINGLKDGWSANIAANRAGFNYHNFRKFLQVMPEAAKAHHDYCDENYMKKMHTRTPYPYRGSTLRKQFRTELNPQEGNNELGQNQETQK
jgi:hypothetical protein